MATPLGPLQALTFVQEQGELGRQRGNQNRLAELASQSYGATTPDQQAGILSQMAAVDPRAAQAQQAQFQSGDDRRNRTLANMANLLVNAPEQTRAGIYQQIRPQLASFGIQAPEAYDASTSGLIDQTARSIASAYGSGGSASGVQSTYINREGQRVAIMRDGSQQVLGDADARTQLRDQEGVAPSIIDLRTGRATALQDSGTAPADGVYIDPSLPPQVQAGIRAAEAAGVPYTGQGGGLTAARPDSSQQITPFQAAQLDISRRSADRADATAEDARAAREEATEARRVANQQKARQAQQAIDTRQAALNAVRRGADRIRNALRAVNETSTGTGPVAQYATRYREAGQELESAIGAMQNPMLALTRVPGVGSQSDLEARIATLVYPGLDRAPSVNENTLRNLDAFIADLAGTAARSDAEDRQSIESAPQGSASRSIRRSGRLPDGRRVIEYSDGTVEYAN